MREVVWRDAVPADLAAIEKLWKAQQEKFQQLAPTVRSVMPDLFYPEGETQHAFYPYKPPVIRVRVEERDGVVTACRIVEVVCEVQQIGGDQDTIRSLGKELPEECAWARDKGFRSGWGLMPKAVAAPIVRALRHTPLRAWPNLELIGCEFSELGD